MIVNPCVASAHIIICKNNSGGVIWCFILTRAFIILANLICSDFAFIDVIYISGWICNVNLVSSHDRFILTRINLQFTADRVACLMYDVVLRISDKMLLIYVKLLFIFWDVNIDWNILKYPL
jgi:hypothetical protein